MVIGVRLGWLRTPAGNIGSNPIHCVTVVGPVAQLGERSNGIREVRGSSPLRSTNFITSYKTAKIVKNFTVEANYMIVASPSIGFGPSTLTRMTAGSTPAGATKFTGVNDRKGGRARKPLTCLHHFAPLTQRPEYHFHTVGVESSNPSRCTKFRRKLSARREGEK